MFLNPPSPRFSPPTNNALFAQVDQRLRVRVLQTDSKKRKLMLTHKKTLINTKLKVISSYAVEAGTVAHGFITGFRKSGIVVSKCSHSSFPCLLPEFKNLVHILTLSSPSSLPQVTFFDNVHGLISIASLRRLLRLNDAATPDHCVDQMKKVYRVGQVGKWGRESQRYFALSFLLANCREIVFSTFLSGGQVQSVVQQPSKTALTGSPERSQPMNDTHCVGNISCAC